MTRNTTVTVGPNTDEGETLVIIRCIQSHDDVTDGQPATIRYECQGVQSIDVQDPWEKGGLTHSSTIGVTFVTGRREYIEGVIYNVGSLDDDSR